MTMKKMVALAFVLMLTLGYQTAPSAGFIPTKLLEIAARALSFSFEDAITHEDMTRSAILDVAAEVLRDNPNPSDSQGSSQRLSILSTDFDEKGLITAYYGYHDHTRIGAFEDAVEAIEKGNSNTDSGEEKKLAAAHFDSEEFESGQNRLINLRHSIISSIMTGNVVKAREDTGRFLHALQDFYSHSNWIENGNRAPNPALGQPNQRIGNVASPTQQTCVDCVKKGLIFKYYECNDNIVQSLKKQGTLTSGYVKGQIPKPYGKCSHGGVGDSTRNTFARGGINKDGPYYKTSPHHYLYDEAVAVAQQASVDMFRAIRRDVNNDQLFGAYLGVFQSQATIESSASASAPAIGSQEYLRGRIRNILLQHHMGRINGNKKLRVI